MRAEPLFWGALAPEVDHGWQEPGPSRYFGFLAMINAWNSGSTCNGTKGDSK